MRSLKMTDLMAWVAGTLVMIFLMVFLWRWLAGTLIVLLLCALPETVALAVVHLMHGIFGKVRRSDTTPLPLKDGRR